MSDAMKVTALAPWFGSKRTMAKAIVEQLGPHKSYEEPFCGSLAVLLAKPACSFEIANDLHGDLTNLAWTIQHERHGPWLYRRLRREARKQKPRLDMEVHGPAKIDRIAGLVRVGNNTFTFDEWRRIARLL